MEIFIFGLFLWWFCKFIAWFGEALESVTTMPEKRTNWDRVPHYFMKEMVEQGVESPDEIRRQWKRDKRNPHWG